MRVDFLFTKIQEHSRKAVEGYNLFIREKNDVHFNNLTMECFQASNYFLDLAEEAVSLLHLGYPANYSDSFVFLQRKGVVSEDEKNQLVEIVALRNRIAHEYHYIREKELLKLFQIVNGIVPIASKIVDAIKKAR